MSKTQKTIEEVTHAYLVARGLRWLTGTKNCSVVVTELSTGYEIPDVLGWYGINTHLIEAKASVSDFRADLKKRFRPGGGLPGMGNYRYYIVPMKLWEKVVDLVPPKWGLLAVGETSVFVKKEPEYFEDVNRRDETEILLSLLRRIAKKENPIKGVGIKRYIEPFPNAREREFFIADDPTESINEKE
jgi:hypothetical protein